MCVVDIAASALQVSALVEITGPDPKQAKTQSSAFSRFDNGLTTVSVSGCFVPGAICGLEDESVVLLTSGHALVPFLIQAAREHPFSASHSSLLPGARLRVRVRGARWESRLQRICELPGAAHAVSRLLSTGGIAGPAAWQLGWSAGAPMTAATATSVAVLTLHMACQSSSSSTGGSSNGGIAGDSSGGSSGAAAAGEQPDTLLGRLASAAASAYACSATNAGGGLEPGVPVVVAGSPFGTLSPAHFEGVAVRGCLAGSVPQQRQQQQQQWSSPQDADGSFRGGAVGKHDDSSSTGPGPAILLADVRCLPGMEGGPVMGRGGRLVGLLAPPLRQPSASVELPLVLPLQDVLRAVGAAAGSGSGGRRIPNGAATSYSGGSSVAGSGGGGARPSIAAITSAISLPLRPFTVAARIGSAAAEAAGAEEGVGCSGSGSGGWETAPGLAAAAAAARSGVVAVATPSGSWASGVLAGGGAAGIVLTVAHLFDGAGGGGGDGGGGRRSPPARVSVRLEGDDGGNGGGGGGGPRYEWRSARVLHVFQGGLDIAAIQLLDTPRQQRSSSLPPSLPRRPSSSFLQLRDYGVPSPPPGSPCLVAGHAVLRPGAGLPPTVWSGCVAKVLPLPADAAAASEPAVAAAAAAAAAAPGWDRATAMSQGAASGFGGGVGSGNGDGAGIGGTPPHGGTPPQGGTPPHGGTPPQGGLVGGRRQPAAALVVSTCSVQPGASGGALVDERGRLLGLVTSNTKHMKGGVVPHLNFSIACDLLRPMWQLAADQQRAGDPEQWRRLDTLDPTLARLWDLAAPPEEGARQLQGSLPPPKGEAGQAGGGTGEGKPGGSKFAEFLQRFGGERSPPPRGAAQGGLLQRRSRL